MSIFKINVSTDFVTPKLGTVPLFETIWPCLVWKWHYVIMYE